MAKLQRLRLSKCGLRGTLPMSWTTGLPSLWELRLRYNGIEGDPRIIHEAMSAARPIAWPACVCCLPVRAHALLHCCSVCCPGIRTWQSGNQLWLGAEPRSGMQMLCASAFGRKCCTASTHGELCSFLGVSRMCSAGTLPASFSRHKALATLDLTSNRINGSLPSEYQHMANLSDLSLSSNLLSGYWHLLLLHCARGELA